MFIYAYASVTLEYAPLLSSSQPFFRQFSKKSITMRFLIKNLQPGDGLLQ